MHYGPLGNCAVEDSATNITVYSSGLLNCRHAVIYVCVCVCGISDLPEREDGEGEETPIFSHWGPPRRLFLFFYFIYFFASTLILSVLYLVITMLVVSNFPADVYCVSESQIHSAYCW